MISSQVPQPTGGQKRKLTNLVTGKLTTVEPISWQFPIPFTRLNGNQIAMQILPLPTLLVKVTTAELEEAWVGKVQGYSHIMMRMKRLK